MLNSYKTLLILSCLILVQIHSLPLTESNDISIRSPSSDVKFLNNNHPQQNHRFLQGSTTTKTSSGSGKVTMENGKWIAIIVGGAVLVTLFVGMTIFWCIKRKLEAQAEDGISIIKVAPFRPTNIDQIQYDQHVQQLDHAERMESEHSITAGDSSAMPFVSANQTIQPTIEDYQRQKQDTFGDYEKEKQNTNEDFERQKQYTSEDTRKADESTIEPLPVFHHENTFAEELANAIEL